MQLTAICILGTSLLAPLRAQTAYDVVPDVVYGHKMGMALTMDLFKPKAQANGAAVLFMVSGGWRSNWTPPETGAALFRPLLEKGFTVFAVRHGSSPKFIIPEIVEDVRLAVRFVRMKAASYGIDADRLGVYGGSAGGHLSLMIGTASDVGNASAKDDVLKVSDRVAAVVAYFPPTDIRPWVQESSEYNKNYPALKFEIAKAPDYSPLLQVTPDDPPTLLIHGDKDTLVPLDHSERILAKFKESNVPAELLVIKGGGHGFRGEDATRAQAAMVAWFERHLAAHKPGVSDSRQR
ncbi:MAG TPA: alpha/beta hydrolase [Bryobacteraceae bacterium]|nr:alpha/beta hydrolase [Bryobacteraceae bacterium]